MNTDDDRSEQGFTRRLMGRIPDVVGRALVAGTGALFLTEEGIRNLVSELKLPGDMVRGLVTQAETTKKELFRYVGQEIRTFMQQANLSEELLRVLAGLTVEIHTSIKFVPNEEGKILPRVRSEVVSPPGAGDGSPEVANEEEASGEVMPSDPVPPDREPSA